MAEKKCRLIRAGGRPYNVAARYAVMGMVQPLSRELMIADLIALIAGLDVVAPEIDR